MLSILTAGGAQSAGSKDELVVYCRDPARGVITRALASECRGEIATEKEFDAARDRSAERRRRILQGGEQSQPAGTNEGPSPAATEPVKEAEAPESAPSEPPSVEKPAEPKPVGTDRGRAAAAPAPAASAPAPKNTGPALEPYRAPPPSLAGLSAEARQIAASLKPGEFRAVSRNTMLSVAPEKDKTVWGVMGPQAVTFWSGAAFDTKRNLLVVNGGGHTDYGGNEVYHFRLDTLAWERVTEPSPYRELGKGRFEVADDAAPVSAHTYDGVVYLANIDRVMRWGGSFYQSGSVTDVHAWLYDTSTRRWTRGAAAPVSASLALEVGGDYDPQTGEAIFTSSNGLVAYNPATDTWRIVRRNDNTDHGRTGAFDPVNRRLVSIGGARSALSYYALSGGGRVGVKVTGNAEFARRRHCGIAYHPSQAFAIWCGGPEVWAVDANTFSSTRFSATPSHRSPTGIWGRWQYVPALDVFVGWPTADAPVYFYKLPRPGEVEGDDTAPPDLQQLVNAAQTAITLPAGEFAQAIRISKPIVVKGAGTVLKGQAYGDKAAVVVAADGVTLEGIAVQDVSNGDNHALLRLERPNATLRNLVSRRNDSHLMSSGVKGGTLTIEGGVFVDARGCVENPGQTHGFYLGYHDRVLARGFDLRRTHGEGHNFKSRAWDTLVEDALIAMQDAAGSRSFDYAMGGNNVIRNSVIQHGPNGNLDIIGFGHETGGKSDVRPAPSHRLTVEGTTIICDRPSCVLLTRKAGLDAAITFRNSVFVGVKVPREYDGGGNRYFATREAAGFPPYPNVSLSMRAR